ncbi:MAG: FimV family protein [Acidiferrobacterales bacterium]
MFWLTVIAIVAAFFSWIFSPVLAAGLALFAGGAIFSVYVWPRGNGKAESEKRQGQPRRHGFKSVTQERRSGMPRRDRDLPRDGMGCLLTEEIGPLAKAGVYLAHGQDGDAEHVLKGGVAAEPAHHVLLASLHTIHDRHRGATTNRRVNPIIGAPSTGPRANRAGSNDSTHAARATPRETATQPEEPQRRRKDGNVLALAIAKANLAMDDTERALHLLNEQLTSCTRHSASKRSSVTTDSMQNNRATADNTDDSVEMQQNVSVPGDYNGAERRKRVRRSRNNRRHTARWDSNQYQRREGTDRRRENLSWGLSDSSKRRTG